MQTFAELVKAKREAHPETEEWEDYEDTKTEGELGWATFEHVYAYLSANLPEGLTLRRDEDGVGWVEATAHCPPHFLAFAFWVRPSPDDLELGSGDYYSTIWLACRTPKVWCYEAGYPASAERAGLYKHMAELAAIALR